MTSGELKDLAVSGAHMSGAQKRAYHKAWVRGEINFDHEQNQAPLPWTIQFNRRFIRLTLFRMTVAAIFKKYWPVATAATLIFFVGFLTSHYL